MIHTYHKIVSDGKRLSMWQEVNPLNSQGVSIGNTERDNS